MMKAYDIIKCKTGFVNMINFQTWNLLSNSLHSACQLSIFVVTSLFLITVKLKNHLDHLRSPILTITL